jgi:hypothetical protein
MFRRAVSFRSQPFVRRCATGMGSGPALDARATAADTKTIFGQHPLTILAAGMATGLVGYTVLCHNIDEAPHSAFVQRPNEYPHRANRA